MTTPTFDGACLGYDGREKFYDGTAWMVYLIDHFLRPGAAARTSTSPVFAGFTFDHVVDGVIAGSRHDAHDLFLISVVANEVSELSLWSPGGRPAVVTEARGWRRVAPP